MENRNKLVVTRNQLRLGGIAAIGAGFMGITFELLGFLSHGPGGFDRKVPVFGLINSDYQRLLIITGILVIIALAILVRYLRPSFRRLGNVSSLALFAGYALVLVAVILDYLAFPYPHQAFGIGFFITLLIVIPLLFAGWLAFGISSVRAGIGPRWSRYLPFVVAASIGIQILTVLLELAGISIQLPISGGLLGAFAGGIVWVLYGYLMLDASRDAVVIEAA